MSIGMDRKVTSPEEFFGYQLGSDRKMARWDKIVDYFWKLDSESDCVRVEEMGKSTEGNPFLVVFISSADNLAELDKYREINDRICDPRGLEKDALRALTAQGKAVVVQSMSLHANEIGGTQMAPELAFELVAVECEDNRRILDNVIFIMVPCFNPDGQIMVTDWYYRWLDTEFEGCNMPYLYHKYAGHDNNRDAFAQNLPETRYMGELLLTKWHPHAYQDHHHMGSYGPRLYIAPYSNPIHPNADPLVWREHEVYGGHMGWSLEENGKTGVITGGEFPGWGHLGYHWLTNHHNVAGMLTESASAKLATPMYVHPEQLGGAHPKNMPNYEAQVNFPHPWPGGWGRLRDIVEQQKIAAWALLDCCAKNRKKILWNAYFKASRQTARGAEGKPVAYAIAPDQNDPLTALKLVNVLLLQGFEVKKAAADFSVGRMTYPAGTCLVHLAQPKMGAIKTLLGRTVHPDGYWDRSPSGDPIVFDSATDTLAEFMGVQVDEIERDVDGEFETVNAVSLPPCSVHGDAGSGYVLDPRLNDSFKVVNALLSKGAKVYRLNDPVCVGLSQGKEAYGFDGCFPAGAFYVDKGTRGLLEGSLVDGVSACAVDLAGDARKTEIKPKRIGIFQRYWGGNADEGWTRFVFENYGFRFVTLMDEDIKGNLIEKVDVVILPADNYKLIVDLDAKEGEPLQLYWPMDGPDEYKSGLGEEGLRGLRRFVEAGGRLVTYGQSSDVAVKALELKVQNVVAGLGPQEYYCHGNTMWAHFDNTNPLAYGMPEKALVFTWDSPAYRITEMFKAEEYATVARYPKDGILQSGLLLGEKRIAGQAAMISARRGKGEVIMIGFRPQFRSQAHSTFKVAFNCLF